MAYIWVEPTEEAIAEYRQQIKRKERDIELLRKRIEELEHADKS